MHIGDPEWRLMDFRAWWREGSRTVDVVFRDDPDGDSRYTGVIDGVRHAIDEEVDLLDLAPVGAEVQFERGGVTVSMRRIDTVVEARAFAVVDRRPRVGARVTSRFPYAAIEGALYALGEVDTERTAPRICFLCEHSDYEPSTGFGGGHLACFVAEAERYRTIATSDSAHERKYGRGRLPFRWVDELDTCPRWERRPPKHGYRG
jgi:hypothetical protein